MSSFLCSLLLTFIFTSQISTATTDATGKFRYICDQGNDDGNYTTNSTYHTNLKTLLSTLTSNKDINYGFYNSSYGVNTDKVNAIGLCRGDVKPDDCQNCLQNSTALLTQLCQNRKEAIGWYDDEKCMLRSSHRLIFGINEMGPAMIAWNLQNATKEVEDEFDKGLKNLLYNLKNLAASGESDLKYAVGSDVIGPNNNQTIFALVQCTPDLSETLCDECLDKSIKEIPNCCDNRIGIGGRFLRPSCYLRYETNSLFYQQTQDSPSSSSSSPSPTPSPASVPSFSAPPPFAENTTSSPGKSNNSTTIGIALGVPIAIVVMVFIFICIYLRLRKPKKTCEEVQEEEEDDIIDITTEQLQLDFNTIRIATNDFSDSDKLGKGGFGAVYKGRLFNGQEVAVKRLSMNSGQGDSEFKNEVFLVAKLQHRNLVRLLGFCLEGRERLLVYEFVCNKSLDYFIFDQAKRAQLNWGKRYLIILGIARGILYLHQDSRFRVIHRDLKASNILLDEHMNPKIADFGMARLFGVDQTQENTNRIVGTYGYMAPEYVMHGQFSVKSDVFSFGILVLEIVSGAKNSSIRDGENTEYLSSFAWRNWREGTATNIIDSTLNNDSRNEILRCIHIGLLCVQENIVNRPTMASIVVMLNSDSVTLPMPFEDLKSLSDSSAKESVNGASNTEPFPR
ncbi:cysteine-rich receptor-like protein kinase 26 [Medicago truncatula]|uniref:Cysteine-rich receptor-kinase-like protein n=1 Tax=Medicago truncatula TaxID=3880 RepID=G7I598_MEDTR|nr:cysteine-rich receptor-like protein kinase 26 [Medicago truncatula]AES59550.2 cysteine-rich receptor-kinase-like protein [Medicago truncatula]